MKIIVSVRKSKSSQTISERNVCRLSLYLTCPYTHQQCEVFVDLNQWHLL